MSFRAVAEHGSFAAAARELGWTQPALSGQVSRLEASLGTSLVTRTVKGVQLTEAGKLLLHHAQVIDGHLTRAVQEISGHITKSMSRVKVVAFPSACTSIVAPAMSELIARPREDDSPAIELEQQEPETASEMLRKGEADVALIFQHPGDNTPSLDGFTQVPLGWDPLQLIVSHRRGSGSPAQQHRLATYARDRWVAGCPSCRRHFLRVAAREGFTPDIRHTTDDYMVVQELVARDMSVSVVPRLSLLSYRHPGVRPYGIGDEDGRELMLLLADDAPRPEVQDVVAALRWAAARILDTSRSG